MRRRDISRRWKLIGSRLFLLLIISESNEGFSVSPSASFVIRPSSKQHFKRQHYCYALSWNHRIVAKAAAVDEGNDHDKQGNFSSSSSSWEAGDVYKDLEALERAIARSNASQNLERQQRIDMMNQFAQERRVLTNDFYRFIFRPFHACLALTILQLLFTTTTTTTSRTSLATRRLFGVLDDVAMAHFRLVILLAPILLYVSIQHRQRKMHASNKHEDLPLELQGIGPEYYRFVVTTDWQDPRTSCQDHVLCLVEQWISVILGTVLVEVLMMCTPLFFIGAATTRTVTSTTTISSTTTTTLARLLQQLITRLAVVASLHQYPKLWFQLNTTQQPRPITWSKFALQTAISMLATPWFMTWNLSRLLVVVVTSSLSLSRSWPFLVGLYSLFVTLFLSIKFWPPPTTTAQQTKPKWVTRNMPLLKRGAILSTMLLFLQCWWNPLLRVIRMARTMKSRELWECCVSKVAFLPFTSSPWQFLTTISTTMLICVAPMCHLVAAARLFRIQYTHDLSLANVNPPEFQQALQEHDRFQWRYRMNWREPKRLRTTLREWRQRLGYWFFFAGSVQEKLRRQQDDVAQRRRQRGGGGGEVKRRGLTVVQRIQQDLGSTAAMSLITDRTKWKHQAMERLAKLHELSYQNGSFHDPLGIAIHRAFDIGLGFNFDHFSNIEDGTTGGELSLSPSTRRLQARAAKSALKRAQEIYTASNAQAELDQIQDPVERNAKAKELRQQADNEIKFIARRLTELIPTDLYLGNRRGMENDEQLRPFELRDVYERTSANEYTLHRSQTIQSLSDLYASRSSLTSTEDAAMYEIDYLNPSGKQPSLGNSRSRRRSNDENDNVPEQDTFDKDDEFIQEWIKNEQSRKDSGTTSTSRDNDEDIDDRTVLA